MAPDKIKTARKVMEDAFEEDPGFYNAYKANIAMLLYDNRSSLKAIIGCNIVADKLIKLIFES